MTTEPSSPKRRHILSSINPEPRPLSPKIEESRQSPEAPPAEEPRHRDEEQAADTTAADTTAAEPARKTSKFRFKSKHSRSRRSSRRDGDERDRKRSADVDPEREKDGGEEPTSSRRHHGHRHRHHHHHHHHHRHKRRRSRSRSPTPPNPYDPPPLDAEAAFRESLFDAMADDEGAAYWEGVYGQPIHVYSRDRERARGPDGELERMDDDEYAAYVRQKMWEKTHQGLLEERARREEQRKKKEAESEEARRLTREMERSLKRGEERRVKRGWKERWDGYCRAWEAWDGTLGGVAWPVRSGHRDDIESAAVREFFVMGIDPVDVGETGFLAKLKDERVRWHPDKIQQRLGGKVDESVMRDVTAVFQIVDKLWTDTRSKQQQQQQQQ